MNENIQNAKALFAPVPRVRLGFFPTPFYKLERMSKELGAVSYTHLIRRSRWKTSILIFRSI